MAKCFIDNLPTGEDYFWGISERDAHKLGLKLGYFIGMSYEDIEWSHAKAFAFVGKAPKFTEYSFLNIAIAVSLGMEVVGEAMDFSFTNPKYKRGYIHQYGVFDGCNKILFKGSKEECWNWKKKEGLYLCCGVQLIK